MIRSLQTLHHSAPYRKKNQNNTSNSESVRNPDLGETGVPSDLTCDEAARELLRRALDPNLLSRVTKYSWLPWL